MTDADSGQAQFRISCYLKTRETAWSAIAASLIVLREPGVLIPAPPDLSLADRTAIIALAIELKALLPIDDRKAGRSASEQLVTTIGTVGILEVAAAKGLIPLSAALAGLQATNMFLSDDPGAQALERDSLSRNHAVGSFVTEC